MQGFPCVFKGMGEGLHMREELQQGLGQASREEA